MLAQPFRAGPVPTSSPAATATPTLSSTSAVSSTPTSSSPPTINAIEMTLILQLDKFSAETAWFVDSSDGTTNFVARTVGYYKEMKSQKIIESFRLPRGLEYQFRILDFLGDGTCCWAGSGWYSLYEGNDIEDNSTQVFYGNGDFGRERVHFFVAGEPKTLAPSSSNAPSKVPSSPPSMMPSYSSMPSVTTYEVELTLNLDNESSQTGWYIASEDDVVIIDRPPGYYSGNDTKAVKETIRLEAGNYLFSVLDSAGDGFCCKQGMCVCIFVY